MVATTLEYFTEKYPDLYSDLKTQLDYIYRWETEKANETFLRQPFGDSWKTMTWGEAMPEARRMTAASSEHGISKKGITLRSFLKTAITGYLPTLRL